MGSRYGPGTGDTIVDLTTTEKVLVADDDPDVLGFVSVNLKLEGYEPILAASGAEAIALTREHQPAVALLDWHMPRPTGLEACQILRADVATSNMAIILFTGKATTADAVSGLKAGADDYIRKPFDPRELMARVKAAVVRRQTLIGRNSLTGLPGNAAIMARLRTHVESGVPFALMHIDLDNFKAFNDHYGFLRGDEAIKLAGELIAGLMHEAPGTFAGHIGGDDFVLICEARVAESLASKLVERFDSAIGSLYDPADLQRGYIAVHDRRGRPEHYPVMTVSIGIADSSRRPIRSHWEASEIANETKALSKMREGSTYSIDRRRESV